MPYGRADPRSAPHRKTGRLLHLVLPSGLAAMAALGCDEAAPGPDPGPAAPVGSALISWSFASASGDAVSCSAAGVGSVRVQLGGEPRTIVCGDTMSTRFEDLLPGRFPVVIERLSTSGAVVETHLNNIQVAGLEETTYTHVFSISNIGGSGVGTLEIRWFIDGDVPARGCAATGGVSIRAVILDGPADVPPFTAPCTEGSRTLEGIRQGNYRVQVTLLDLSEQPVGFPALENGVFVTQNMTETVSLDIVTQLPVAGQLLARWTLSSTGTEARCAGPPECTVEVSVRTDVSQSVSTTASAAVSRGAVFFEDLPVGRSPEGAGLRATYRLIERALGSQVLDTEIVRDIVLQPSRTGTVTVELAAPDGG